jgi:hypothetical protein
MGLFMIVVLTLVFPNASLADSFITINPIFDASITGDVNAAAIENTINSAIAYFDSHILSHNALTTSITFKEGPGLGGSAQTVYQVGYMAFTNALHNASSGDATDTTALAHTPISGTNFLNTSNVILTSADCIGLGLGCGSGNAIITLNTSLTNPGSPGSTSQFLLKAVAEHEIDEILGIGGGGSFIGRLSDPGVMDLFRYDHLGNRTHHTLGPDDAFFSLDGTTDLVQFNQALAGGDYGDWWSGNGLGNGPCSNPPGSTPARVQDAFACPGTTPDIATDAGTPELIALDAIGYNLAVVSAPEPTTLVLLGFGLLVGAGKFRGRGREER